MAAEPLERLCFFWFFLLGYHSVLHLTNGFFPPGFHPFSHSFLGLFGTRSFFFLFHSQILCILHFFFMHDIFTYIPNLAPFSSATKGCRRYRRHATAADCITAKRQGFVEWPCMWQGNTCGKNKTCFIWRAVATNCSTEQQCWLTKWRSSIALQFVDGETSWLVLKPRKGLEFTCPHNHFGKNATLMRRGLVLLKFMVHSSQFYFLETCTTRTILKIRSVELVFWSWRKAFSVDHLREPSGKKVCDSNVAVYVIHCPDQVYA